MKLELKGSILSKEPRMVEEKEAEEKKVAWIEVIWRRRLSKQRAIARHSMDCLHKRGIKETGRLRARVRV